MIKRIKKRITNQKLLYFQLKKITDTLFDNLTGEIEYNLQTFCEKNDLRDIKYEMKIRFKPRIGWK